MTAPADLPVHPVVRLTGPRQVQIVEEPAETLGDGDVRIATLFSGISAGTELTAYRGTNPYLNKRWDPEHRLFVPGSSSLDYPIDGSGYEEVGEVADVGNAVTGVAAGDLVCGTWGHRASVVLTEAEAAARPLPAGLDPLLGIFSQIGAIALNVVLDADIHVGETVAVFGLGVPGQIVAQLARLNGARVITVDRIPDRLAMARRLGAAETIDAGRVDAAERVHELTDGRGADVSLEVSGAYPALHDAIRSTAYSARVVAAGFFQAEGVGLALGEEFHHNRVSVVCSQISGVAPTLSYRWNAARLQGTVMALAASGSLQLRPLVSHIMDVGDAAEAFHLLDRSPESALQVVLQFPRRPNGT